MHSREAPLDIGPDEFRTLGHALVDRIADFLGEFPAGPVTTHAELAEVRDAVGRERLPERGTPAARLLEEAADVLFRYSLFNGHPRFWGFITASAAPIGILSEMLAAAINPNLGGWILAPSASEIERQTIRWIAQLIGFPDDCGGLLVSGGNVANFVGFWVGRRVRTPWDLRQHGYDEAARPVRVYASRETHTWIQKAADLSGIGTDAIRWIDTDRAQRMDVRALRKQIETDRAAGNLPLIVVGTAGSVSTGAIDPLREIHALCREHGLWFHIDGAYGAPAAVLPDAPDELKALGLADSIAIDPHKWLYAPLEAGCALVRDATAIHETFAFHPPYYPEPEATSDDAPIYYHEFGPQNSRGFRALKVWLGLRHAGREGMIRMISEDIALARRMFDLADADPELEAVTHALSIATFRFVPEDLREARNAEAVAAYLDALNRDIVERIQAEGEAFVSNAVIEGRFVLRACIVNFRTSEEDVAALIEIVRRVGREVDAGKRPELETARA
ncbi:MAG: pyridoxal phosphate-dependent decarboxylase family protein [Longimicrobiales bacterium]